MFEVIVVLTITYLLLGVMSGVCKKSNYHTTKYLLRAGLCISCGTFVLNAIYIWQITLDMNTLALTMLHPLTWLGAHLYSKAIAIPFVNEK